MRNLLLSVFALTLFVFTSCEDDVKIVDEAGNISGMGNAGGELDVEEFVLPEGFSFDGDIVGGLEEATSAESSLKSTTTWPCFGNGGKQVRIKCKIRNESNRRKTCWFPPGLCFKVKNAGYQNAILVCWVWISFEPNQVREFYLDLHCINYGLTGSKSDARYIMCGITKSKRLKQIINKCKRKKLQRRWWNKYRYDASLKSADNYDQIASELQDVVWAETNNEGITLEQEMYLDNLPDLDDDVYPPTIDDEDFLKNPPYWEE